jgi:hypothetical protein
MTMKESVIMCEGRDVSIMMSGECDDYEHAASYWLHSQAAHNMMHMFFVMLDKLCRCTSTLSRGCAQVSPCCRRHAQHVVDTHRHVAQVCAGLTSPALWTLGVRPGPGKDPGRAPGRTPGAPGRGPWGPTLTKQYVPGSFFWTPAGPVGGGAQKRKGYREHFFVLRTWKTASFSLQDPQKSLPDRPAGPPSPEGTFGHFWALLGVPLGFLQKTKETHFLAKSSTFDPPQPVCTCAHMLSQLSTCHQHVAAHTRHLHQHAL